MKKTIGIQARRMVALVLVMVLATPYIALAEGTARSAWLEENLPEIPHLGVIYDPAETEAYILSTIPEPFHIERGDAETIYQDAAEREAIDFAWLLFDEKYFSELTQYERTITFNQLEISQENTVNTVAFLSRMERDGYSFADSVNLLRIMSTNLLDYTEARTIFANFPRYEEHMSELLHFELLAQRHAELSTVSSGALRLETGTSTLDEERQMFLSGNRICETAINLQTTTRSALSMDIQSRECLYSVLCRKSRIEKGKS